MHIALASDTQRLLSGARRSRSGPTRRLMRDARSPDSSTLRRRASKQPALARAKQRSKGGYRESYDKDVSSMEFGVLLEEAGALVARRGPLSAWCEEVGAYELVTSELVEAIAAYVDERLPTIDREQSATSALLAATRRNRRRPPRPRRRRPPPTRIRAQRRRERRVRRRGSSRWAPGTASSRITCARRCAREGRTRW